MKRVGSCERSTAISSAIVVCARGWRGEASTDLSATNVDVEGYGGRQGFMEVSGARMQHHASLLNIFSSFVTLLIYHFLGLGAPAKTLHLVGSRRQWGNCARSGAASNGRSSRGAVQVFLMILECKCRTFRWNIIQWKKDGRWSVVEIVSAPAPRERMLPPQGNALSPLDIAHSTVHTIFFFQSVCWIWIGWIRLSCRQELGNEVNTTQSSLPAPTHTLTPGTPTSFVPGRDEDLLIHIQTATVDLFDPRTLSFDGLTEVWIVFYHISKHLQHKISTWLPLLRPVLWQNQCPKHCWAWETHLCRI